MTTPIQLQLSPGERAAIELLAAISNKAPWDGLGVPTALITVPTAPSRVYLTVSEQLSDHTRDAGSYWNANANPW